VSDETLSRIANWCAAENDLEIEGRTITVGGLFATIRGPLTR